MNGISAAKAVADSCRRWSGWLLLVGVPALAQPSPLALNSAREPVALRLNGTAGWSGPVALEPYAEIFGDTTHGSNQFVQVTALPFRPLATSGFSDESYENLFWFRLRLANVHPRDTLRVIIYAGDPVGLRLVKPNERIGSGFRLWPFRLVWPDSDRFGVPITLPPGLSRTCYLQTTNLISFAAFQPRLYSEDGYRRFDAERVKKQQFPLAFSALIFGICLFLGSIGFILLLKNRDVVYAWWACYLWANSLFLYVSADLEFNLGTLPFSMQVLLEPIEYLMECCYFLFFDAILNLKKYDSLSHRICQALIFATGLSVLVTIVSFWVDTLPVLLLSQNDEFLIIGIGVFSCVLIRVIMRPIPEKSNILIGSALLTLFAGLALYVDVQGKADSRHLWLTPHIILGVGVFMELLFFSLALSERALVIRVALARAEEEKARLNEEKARQEADLHLQLSKAENAALRAQMSPHFIFNSLNAIQALTNQQQSTVASDYLAKFARLIRRVLENSRSDQVRLSQELETVELYLAMEVMRFEEKLRYRIRVDQRIDTDAILIPPLLLQPFVENAVWHGLMHKPDGGLVDIEVDALSDGHMHITITDDGVGRQKAAAYKSQSSTQYKSYGTEVTAERIALINQLHKTQIQTAILDLVSPGGQALGTKVIVDIHF